jgi:two-component system phosphate regulon sensor histidine kinase PhoR
MGQDFDRWLAAALVLAALGVAGSIVSADLRIAAGTLAASGIALAFWRARVWHEKVHTEMAENATRAALIERQLDSQREAMDSLADGVEVGIFLCDAKGVVAYANRRAIQIFRFENPVGRPILAVTLSYDLERLVEDSVTRVAAVTREVTLSYPRDRIAIARAWPESDAGDRFFVSVLDITDLRHLERVRQDFVANVSHELRTPMTTVRAMAETLLDAEDDEHELRHRYLSKIIAEVDRLTRISNDLLTLSTAEAGIAPRGVCDLGGIVSGVLLQFQPQIASKGLTVETEIEPDCVISANEEQMQQVAINLIDNAIQYTPSGTIRVRVRRTSDGVEFAVEDTGIGIATEHLPRVFERFYRVDKARSRVQGGTGLGLSIVRHLVESQGGRVSVESELNKGSVFTAWLPAARSRPVS